MVHGGPLVVGPDARQPVIADQCGQGGVKVARSGPVHIRGRCQESVLSMPPRVLPVRSGGGDLCSTGGADKAFFSSTL